MSDSEVREIVLRVFYEKKAENFIPINKKIFGDQYPISEIYRICFQLKDLKYIDFKAQYAENEIYTARGKITVFGIDHVEQMRKEKSITSLTIEEINCEIDRIVNFELNGDGYGAPEAREADERKLRVLMTLREQKLTESQTDSYEIPSVSNPKIAKSLREHLAKISDSDTKAFVEEGIECFERHLYRSAVILTWVGAISLLQTHVVDQYLNDFNNEATKRDSKWRSAKTTDDIARMREYDFLQIIEKLSIIGKNVKQEMEKQLELRNGCGHPNTLRISENVVAAHIEILILNVFAKFS